jgi:hypothetical protein
MERKLKSFSDVGAVAFWVEMVTFMPPALLEKCSK